MTRDDAEVLDYLCETSPVIALSILVSSICLYPLFIIIFSSKAYNVTNVLIVDELGFIKFSVMSLHLVNLSNRFCSNC